MPKVPYEPNEPNKPKEPNVFTCTGLLFGILVIGICLSFEPALARRGLNTLLLPLHLHV
jgi:hypothetical protein